MYNESVGAQVQVNFTMLNDIFSKEFNIGFSGPRVDVCTTSEYLKTKIKSCMLNKCFLTCSKRQASNLIVDFDEEKAISGKKWVEGGIRLIVSTGSLKKASNELESKMLHS